MITWAKQQGGKRPRLLSLALACLLAAGLMPAVAQKAYAYYKPSAPWAFPRARRR